MQCGARAVRALGEAVTGCAVKPLVVFDGTHFVPHIRCTEPGLLEVRETLRTFRKLDHSFHINTRLTSDCFVLF